MDPEKIRAADPSPYEEIRVKGENIPLARKLSAAFGGSSGEFDTIALYTYQSIIFRESFPEYSKAIMKIAMVEMKHLDMIGELIYKLGGDPVFGAYTFDTLRYWNGENVNYTNDLATALLFDLQGEQKAYSEYVSLARQSGDRYVFGILMRIALDEMVHTALIRSMINRLRHVER